MEWLISLLVSWLFSAIALWVAARLINGIHLSDFKSAFVVAIIFGLCNALLGWLFWVVLTIGTFGLALLLSFITRIFVMALILKITAGISSKFDIDGFWPAVWGAIIVALTTGVLDYLFYGSGGA